jgi:hypothetical protein
MILSRWLHIYLSMASFAIVFFFAITGLTLNHAEWFAAQQKTLQLRGQIDSKLIQPDVMKPSVVDYLRHAHHLNGAVNDFRVETEDCAVSFKGPGYSADVFIDRATGGYELTETRMGWVAILNDLHKGRDSGKAWAHLIDLSAGLLTLVSTTGLMLIFFLHKKRISGLLILVMGGILCWMAYVALVP